MFLLHLCANVLAEVVFHLEVKELFLNALVVLRLFVLLETHQSVAIRFQLSLIFSVVPPQRLHILALLEDLLINGLPVLDLVQ